MSRVITFSRYFPKAHPRAGEPTYFVEKIWRCYADHIGSVFDLGDYQRDYDDRPDRTHEIISIMKFDPKHHTIRAGNRWKVGDKFSPRVWSGKPYASKQIVIAPDIELKKVWDINITWGDYSWFISSKENSRPMSLDLIAKNDGLEPSDFKSWFNTSKRSNYGSFTGQILCWNESINY
jgi:hypothetical protein